MPNDFIRLLKKTITQNYTPIYPLPTSTKVLCSFIFQRSLVALNVNTISEWILIFSAIFFWSSFLYEMMEINKSSTKLIMKSKEQINVFLPEKVNSSQGLSEKPPTDHVIKLNEIERVAL